jgi:hypothetical protein
MCKECGCGQTNGNTRLQFTVKRLCGMTMCMKWKRHLLGMPGVLYVHIHAHEGATTIDYNPAKTKLMDILQVFYHKGLTANI